MTYHPRGGSSSSDFFHQDLWLDVNMYQSGHSQRYNNVYFYAEKIYNKKPVKPFVDGEPAYEDIPIRFWEYCDWSLPKTVPDEVLNQKGLIMDRSYFKDGFLNAHDIRVHAYCNFLSGACGYTCGNNAVWQMFKKGGSIAIPCLIDWREALDRPGANDIRHLMTFFEKYSFYDSIPDQSTIDCENTCGEKHIRAAISNDKSYIIAYTAIVQLVSLNTGNINQGHIEASWYNPRNGESQIIGEFRNSGSITFMPPGNQKNEDWLLVLYGLPANQH